MVSSLTNYSNLTLRFLLNSLVFILLKSKFEGFIITIGLIAYFKDSFFGAILLFIVFPIQILIALVVKSDNNRSTLNDSTNPELVDSESDLYQDTIDNSLYFDEYIDGWKI